MTVVERLHGLGARVRAHDAHVPADVPLAPGVERVDCTPAELAAADLVVLLVDHPDLPFDDIAAHAPLVLDTRARLRGHAFRGEVL
jgi:UDP-N-acetyl-D-glucosamine dehydrogenase